MRASTAARHDDDRESDLVTDIVKVLRQQILDGELNPGARVYEAKVARELGISRGPIREASRLLQREGLLVSEANRGFIVRQITIRELVEITDFRTCIEAHASRAAAVSPKLPQLIDALLQTLDEYRKRCDEGDRIGQVATDFHFHRQIVESTGNRRLVSAFDMISNELRIAMRLMGRTANDKQLLVDSHAELTEALRTRDPDIAERAAKSHIHLAWDETLERLQSEMDAPLSGVSQ